MTTTPPQVRVPPIPPSPPLLPPSRPSTLRSQTAVPPPPPLPPAPPTRNKSSSALSTHSTTRSSSSTNLSSRPKRNKSSSSLLSYGTGHGAGHHAVQFAHHHPKKPGHKPRTGSHGSSGGLGRKGAFDFGFTSMHPESVETSNHASVMPASGDEGDDPGDERGDERGDEISEVREEKIERQRLDTRMSSNGSVATLKSNTAKDEPERGRSKSRDRNARDTVEKSPTRTTARDEGHYNGIAKDNHHRDRSKNHRGATVKLVIGSINESSASDWESATDSPLPVKKELPSVQRRSYNGTGLSGLGQVLGEGDRVEATEADVHETQQSSRLANVDSRPATPTKTPKTRAKFSIDDTENDESPPAVRSPSLRGEAEQQQPEPPTTSSSKMSPRMPQTSTLPLTGPVASTPSPVQHRYRPSHGSRKYSNASALSIQSIRSLAPSMTGLMGPPTQGKFRRSASSLIAPLLDRATVAMGELAVTGSSPSSLPRQSRGFRGMHQRDDSMGSIRSLRSVAEGSQAIAGLRRSQTSSEIPTRQLRLNKSEGGAMASLSSLGGKIPGSPMGAPPRRSTSGYLSTLRGFAHNLPGMTPPPLSPTLGGRNSIGFPSDHSAGTPGGAGISGVYIGKGKGKPPTSLKHTPIVSKFIEISTSYSDSPAAALFSTSPQATRGGIGSARNQSSGNLGGGSGGAMSRTQQKALLARDAPWANGGGGPSSSSLDGLSSNSGIYSQVGQVLPLPPPTSKPRPTPHQGGQSLGLNSNLVSSTVSQKMSRTGSHVGGIESSGSGSSSGFGHPDPSRQLGMQKWAMGLVREAERIERQYQAVEKWRDPLGESLERVMNSSGSGRKLDKLKSGSKQMAVVPSNLNTTGLSTGTSTPTSAGPSLGGGVNGPTLTVGAPGRG